MPAENLIGREGDGFKIAMATFDRSRPTVAAQAVGLAQGAIDLALDYVLRRHSFGQPLIGHQGVQFKLADMETEVAAARSSAWSSPASSPRRRRGAIPCGRSACRAPTASSRGRERAKSGFGDTRVGALA